MPAVAHAQQWPTLAPLLDRAAARTNADAVERKLQGLLSANERRVVRLRYGIGAQAGSVAVIARRLGLRRGGRWRNVRARRRAACGARARSQPCGRLQPSV